MTITYDDFKKLDLRVAIVIAAEKVEGSEKLLKLQLDLGPELGTRQIVSGVARQYDPASLVGTQIVIVANLEPRSLMGLESAGMLLAAHGTSGEAILLRPDPGAPAGSTIS